MVIEVTFDTTDVYISTTVSPVYVNVSFEAPAGGGGAEWGDITGTLSDQTDLQTALDAKVPYTGATQDVNLGEYEIKAGQVTLDTSPTGTAAVGTTRWNDTTGLTETTLKGGNVILKNGVDLVARVVNKVSPNTTLTKAAYQAVRVSGAQGQRLAVALAQANNDANSADTIGLVTETIATNQEGFIMTVGQLENINTTGSLQSETWVDGDVLYLSPTTAGAITKVKPTGNGHIVVIGYVEYAHANNGKIYVKVMNGWELDELHDVAIVSPANNEALIYESATALWKNKSIATALGYTPANAATTLTINGVTYDLSTSRTWSVGSVTGSGASGQVAYWTGASSQSGSNNLFWDNTNGRLGIGTATPSAKLDIYSTSLVQSVLGVGESLASKISINQSSFRHKLFQISRIGDAGTPVLQFGAGSGPTSSSAIIAATNDNLIFGYDLSNTFNETFRITTTKNLLLGSTTDSGERLQVTGTMKVTTSGMFGTNTQSAGVKLETDGVFRAWTKLEVGQFGNASYTTTDFSKSASGSSFYSFTNNTSYTATSGSYYHLQLSSNIAPTSGTGVFNYLQIVGTINQQGGANGITRGLYVNPTLTAAADFRAIETTNGKVIFGNLPTSSAGLPTGAIWNDAGTLKIV